MAYPAVEVLLGVCARAKKEESVLVVTDTDQKHIARAFTDRGLELGYQICTIEMPTRSTHGENPPATVAAAMKAADIIFGATKFSLYHSSARKEAVANGARFVNMADYTLEMLSSGPLLVDFEKQREVVFAVAKVLTEGKWVKITSKEGTDIEFSIEGRRALAEPGMSIAPGETSSPPDIEAELAPVEGTANGRVVIDGSIPQPGIGVITTPIEFIVKDGFITEIIGDTDQAETLRKQLAASGNPNNYNVAELGIGLNPLSKFSGSMLEDEGVFGSAHIGIGNNTAFPGGTLSADVHIDAMMRKPTIIIDGKPLFIDGEFAEGAI
jgi:leucyl aminopeptidase (aminopeptidase T)